MARNPNQGGKGPSVSKAKGKGPITGNRDKLTGTTRPWSLKGTSKSMNFGKSVKKS